MRAALLAFAALAAGLAWLASRAQAPADDATANLGDAGPLDLVGFTPADVGLSAVPAPAAPLTTGLDFSPVFDVFGYPVKNSNATTWQPPTTAAPYLDTIAKAETAQGLPDGLLARVLYQESRFRDDIISGKVASPTGALGIAQFMPGTAKDLGIDPLDPNSAIPGAARYLKQLFNITGSWDKAIASYNWGVGNVQKKGLALAPAETRNYLADVKADVPSLA